MAALPSSKSLILVVEDDAAIRDFLRTALTSAGYRLAEAITGEEVLDRAARKPPELVILDLGLPDVDGQLVLQKLREWFKAPIIVLSGATRNRKK